MDEYEPDLKHIQSATLSSPVEYLQIFNPLFRSFLKPEIMKNPKATLKTKYEFADLETVKETDTSVIHKRPVYIKYSPLLDPLRYMTGKYDGQPEMDKQGCFLEDYPIRPTKYRNLNNASYVDSFFCFLSSKLLHENGLLNAIDFYGSFVGIQQEFSIDIFDDYEYLNDFPVFLRKMNSGEIVCPDFTLLQQLNKIGGNSNNSSRGNKQRICLENAPVEEDVLLSDIVLLENATELGEEKVSSEEMIMEYEKEPTGGDDEYSEEEEDDDGDDDENTTESETTEGEDENDFPLLDIKKGGNSDDTEMSEADSEESVQEDGDEDDENGEDDEEKMMATIKNFPVQLICLERCEGTLDSVFCNEEINSEICMAYAFQIVATLAAYQKAFSFTHNDLHTNNIVYASTTQTHLHYRLFGKSYCVPTHGKIIKIIDFGRSVYRFRDRKIMSDGFSPTGDAHTQYNTEPYYNSQQPRIDENPSFDLCRLGCSIYDFIFDDETKKLSVEKMDNFQKLVHRWCLDDKGKSVLYKRNGEERYPNFKLYKMIARTVHNHTPENQMSDFDMFLCDDNKKIARKKQGWINIDKIPVFYV